MQPLVSVIIPTFNRAHLIGETLDSVLAQTYQNWECIVVDDGSTDNTREVIQAYCAKDIRFNYHNRPDNRPKGANACRNYGFKKANGTYINWFDSDDIMEPVFLYEKINLLKSRGLDFVVSKTLFFDDSNNLNEPRYFLLNDSITLRKFVCENQFWLTLDGLFLRSAIKNVKWNENLMSGQEYNFICKFLNMGPKGFFLNKFLAKARMHDNSIQSNQNKNERSYAINKYKAYFTTYKELKELGCFSEERNLEIKNHLFKSFMSQAYSVVCHNKRIPCFFILLSEVIRLKGLAKTFIFIGTLITGFVFKKGYTLMNYSRK